MVRLDGWPRLSTSFSTHQFQRGQTQEGNTQQRSFEKLRDAEKEPTALCFRVVNIDVGWKSGSYTGATGSVAPECGTVTARGQPLDCIFNDLSVIAG